MLQHLMLPSDAALSTIPEDVIPRKLRELVLTRTYNIGLDDWLLHASRKKAECFPELSMISVYFREKDSAVEHSTINTLITQDIRYCEYIPECCLIEGLAYRHPWCFTPAELKMAEDVMHDEWKQNMDAKKAKKRVKVERRLARSTEKGIRAMRYQFTTNAGGQ
ncbi:hypothetical protein EK21DRAFT_111536 [Setomelanomma holmii]|uniref:Uncharacterized protein n=1 Tax=Setomelanomma holmii TaxID=210430 RepID=A0A9P4HA53_9PLEO|nr:hypothetical protein EK21DRAFT_111536 [Setomelanomma holmii]